MKKSKFLKKSLAMLLAVMLVVAMIPLSASASDPNLQQVYVSADDEPVMLTQNGNTYTGNYRNGAREVDLTLVVGSGNLVYYTNTDTSATTDQQVTVTDNVATFTVDTDQYTNAEGNVEVKFSVADSNDPKVRENYTVILTPVTVSTETLITDFELDRDQNGNTIPNVGTASIGVDFVNVTVPYDAINGAAYVIRNMAVSAGATWSITRSGAPVANGDDEGIVNRNPAVPVQDGDVIAITNGGRTQTYTLHISVADGFKYFQTAEGLDAVMFPDDQAIVVLLPFGTAADANGGDITVTPIFELDYPSAVATWGGHEINGVDDTITIDADDVVDGENGMTPTFVTFEGTTNSDWTGRKENAGSDFGVFASGTGIDGRLANITTAITLTYADESTRTYNVYFMETAQNNETEIDRLIIGSEDAVIDQDAKTIDITLPNGTDLSNVNLSSASNTTAATMTASYGADIDFVIPSVAFTGAGARSATQTFTAANTPADLRQAVSVRVRSQDYATTGNETFYTLNVNASSEYQKAEITSFTIQNDDGYSFTAKPDKNGNVTLEVPYEIYDKDLLGNGSWSFFYTKGIGTLATVNGTALPVTGSTIDLTNPVFAAMLPEVGDKSVGDPIAVRMVGEDLTVNSQQYKITINRAAAKTESSLEKFTLVGDEAWEVPGAAHTYQGTVNNTNKTISANASWTAGKYWASHPFEAIAEVAEDSNARVFYQGTSGGTTYLMELVNSGNTGATDVYNNTTNTTWRLFDGQTIVVMSEELWVEIASTPGAFTTDSNGTYISQTSFQTFATGSNGGHYTTYTLDLGTNGPEEGAGLTDVTLVDGTGWEADLTIDIKGGTLECLDVPYALTTELDENGDIEDTDTVNPIFLTYDFKDANRAYMLGSDNTLTTANQANPDGLGLPTAGTSGNAIFTDMADFTGGWTEDKYEDYVLAGNPFLLISRDGDMYVYNYNTSSQTFVRNTAVKADSLTVCSENGKDAYQSFELKLKVAEPNAGTDFQSFYFTGYERFPATVDSKNHTISVVLPFGTEYTYLVPNYTLTSDSQGAIVTVDDPELLGKPVRTGVTDVNFTSTRKFTVIAENETAMTEWTVNVTVADEFSDVTTKDWFYNDVMAAAGFGYVNGMGNGKYEPYGTTTRAQFAKILAEALGYDASAYTTSAFPDVSEDHWAMAAIAFCADQEIILGYDTGNFEPSKTITRQEAALMLQRAFDLQGNESNLYPDDAKIAGWAEDGVYAVKHAGLMKGDADTGNFRPNSTLNRAEMATILMNAHRAGLIK